MVQRMDAEVREEDRRREGRRKREGRKEGGGRREGRRDGWRGKGKVIATQAVVWGQVLHVLDMVVFACHCSTWQAVAGGLCTAK